MPKKRKLNSKNPKWLPKKAIKKVEKKLDYISYPSVQRSRRGFFQKNVPSWQKNKETQKTNQTFRKKTFENFII